MFTKKISCYYHEKEIGPKSFIKGSLAHSFYIVHFYTEINCVQLKAITSKCTSQTNLIATTIMYKERRQLWKITIQYYVLGHTKKNKLHRT